MLVTLNFTKGMGAAFTFITLLATLAALVPYAFCALVELMLFIRDPSRYRGGPHLGRTVTLRRASPSSTPWAPSTGPGPEVVFYGFLLLLAGVPVFVWVRWRTLADSRRIADSLGNG